MTPYLNYLETLAVLVLALPLLACLAVGLPALLWRPLSERAAGQITAAALSSSLLATLALAYAMATLGVEQFEVDLGALFVAGDYAFELDLLVDHLTVPYMVLSTALLGLIGKFSATYFHREAGYQRFFCLLLLFATGMLTLSMAGTIDLMFAGWELVGLTSALLIGFFHNRAQPVENALWTFSIYRVCDVGLLAAAVVIHATAHTAKFSEAFAPCAWPLGTSHLSGSAATAVGLLLIFAALGKSAQVPFTGWLPRAMEGPTPSSAIFYGALSIHAGAYLLLRAAPVLEASPLAAGTLVTIGVLTALHGTFVGRVQTDVKSALAYASATQVGLILAEIGLGFRLLALVHLCGHACLRTLQLLRAPSALLETTTLQQQLASELPKGGLYYERLFPQGVRRWLYALALERGHHDTLLLRLIVRPLLAGGRALERLERALGGDVDDPPRGALPAPVPQEPLEATPPREALAPARASGRHPAEASGEFSSRSSS